MSSRNWIIIAVVVIAAIAAWLVLGGNDDMAPAGDAPATEAPATEEPAADAPATSG